MTANKITIPSNATNNKTVLTGMISSGAKAAFDNRINNKSWGIIIGNPSTAMIAAFCCALAAIAARKVNTRLKLQPPSNTNPINCQIFCIGLPKNRLNKNKLIKLIASISKELKRSLASTKSPGLAIE